MEQWVKNVTAFSSEYIDATTPTEFKEHHLIGPNDADFENKAEGQYPLYAWAPLSASGQDDYVELQFEHSVTISSITVHEVYGGNAITFIKAWTDGAWVTLYSKGKGGQRTVSPRVFSPSLQTTAVRSNMIRIEVVCGGNLYTCLDAVKLTGDYAEVTTAGHLKSGVDTTHIGLSTHRINSKTTPHGETTRMTTYLTTDTPFNADASGIPSTDISTVELVEAMTSTSSAEMDQRSTIERSGVTPSHEYNKLISSTRSTSSVSLVDDTTTRFSRETSVQISSSRGTSTPIVRYMALLSTYQTKDGTSRFTSEASEYTTLSSAKDSTAMSTNEKAITMPSDRSTESSYETATDMSSGGGYGAIKDFSSPTAETKELLHVFTNGATHHIPTHKESTAPSVFEHTQLNDISVMSSSRGASDTAFGEKSTDPPQQTKTNIPSTHSITNSTLSNGKTQEVQPPTYQVIISNGNETTAASMAFNYENKGITPSMSSSGTPSRDEDRLNLKHAKSKYTKPSNIVRIGANSTLSAKLSKRWPLDIPLILQVSKPDNISRAHYKQPVEARGAHVIGYTFLVFLVAEFGLVVLMDVTFSTCQRAGKRRKRMANRLKKRSSGKKLRAYKRPDH